MIRNADIVLAGGGVKCIALCGAIERLDAAGYRFRRVAGTSAGAFTGAVLAALSAQGRPPADVVEIARNIPYESFASSKTPRLARPLKDGMRLLKAGGLHDGAALREWTSETLAELGVRTFADLKLPDGELAHLPEEQRYRLVVVASDVTTHRPIRLPWDYPLYGLEPDEQYVAEAVQMSTSIPFYFQPVNLSSVGGQTHAMVDGGVFMNYPINLFDPAMGRPDIPAFGVRLLTKDELKHRRGRHVRGPLSLGCSLVESMISACDSMHISQPAYADRSILVDTSPCPVSAVSFNISDEQAETLLGCGRTAADEFLDRWDFDAYCESHFAAVA